MQHPEKPDQNIGGQNTNAGRRLARQDVLVVRTYHDAIHNLSLRILEIDWTESEDNSTKIKTVDGELRSIIATIEGLRGRPIETRIRLNGVLQNLNDALTEFSRARTLAKTNAQLKLSKDDKDDVYEKVKKCRDYLYLAEIMMILNRQKKVDNS